ncbi:hypothetical protein GALMADRAFT_211560 [Galerina marginata CBS 339.88]|uniref:alpha-L-rhamnosidase n=1 Tax=Galerina marginata (strain CBS 339.88) TaxID=685588 RepID=A0A067SWQ1_GALM3|nr:hypothetical protein GALMADRAFT_211560 [Galerina marginata CBS 339.88]
MKDVLAQALQLGSLRVENKVAPVGIDVNPRFSWTITSIAPSSVRGVVQTSYRIRLSTVKSGNSDLWDSGVVQSNIPYLREYAGPALTSDTHYFWSVDVVTSAGSTSASSEFTTGLLSSSDWGSSLWIGKPLMRSGISSALASTFNTGSWIWTNETEFPNAPAADRAFRKIYNTPTGKVAASATVVITADDLFTLYVNGQSTGSSPNVPDIWKSAQVFNVSLNSSLNLFAVFATNRPAIGGGDGPAGLLAAIQVNFLDGTSALISTDSSWLASKTIPDNFQSPSFNDSQWPAAVIEAKYGSGVWGSQVIIAPPSTIPTPTLSNSIWIWPNVAPPPEAPAGAVAFRKQFFTPSGKTLQSATVIITVDNQFTLYINGNVVGSSPDETDSWESAQQFTVSLSGTSTLFAVYAVNLPDVNTGGASPAGLLAVIQMQYTDGTVDTIISDTTWKSSTTVPNGFQLTSFDDSTWGSPSSLGAYGVAPWNTGVSIADPLGEHPAPLMRKEFTVAKQISFARLYYAAGGYASISINGKPASDHVLTPGFTNWVQQVQYVGLDVASALQVGTNAIGIELGRGHYAVTQGSVWNWNGAPWHAEPNVRIVLSIGYSDGSSTRVVSDASWRVTEGPTRLDDVFGGENFNAKYIQKGYDLAGFNDAAWNAAQIIPGPAGALLNARQPPTRVLQTLTPVKITQPVTGIYVVAFERVVSGWARVTATGPANTLITIHFGEKLNSDGTVIYQDVLHYFANNFQTDRFWLAGTGGPEIFEPKFSYKGYQYVQIEGWPGSSPPTAANVLGMVVHDDLAPTGDFSSSNDLLNAMHKASVFTILNNLHSIPEDCPTFEKNGWSGDAMLGTEMILTNLDAQDLLAKYTRDLDESIPANGQGPPAVIAPDSGWGANNHAPTWHSAFIFIPWWLYQYRGDQRVLSDHYARMKTYVQFELGRSPNNIASTGLGDWDTPETNPDGGNPPEDNRVSATAFLYGMLTTMNQVATVLGNTADASTFANQAANVKMAFNNAFLNSTTGFYNGVGDQGYRQAHNLLALSFGLTPNNNSAQVVADSVVTDIISRGTHLNTGALATKALLPMLSEHGHADTAYAVSQQTTFPSWGFWFANGATTTQFLGTYQDWLYKNLAGIKLSATAFQQVEIAPLHTAQLTSARAWTITPFGNLSVAWSNDAGGFNLNVNVPIGVTATVAIPALAGQSVLESGKQLQSNGAIRVDANTPSKRVVVVGSGAYSFTVTKTG